MTRAMPVNLPSTPPNAPKVGILVAETNRRIGAFSGQIVCQSTFLAEQVSMLKGWMYSSPSFHQSYQTSVNLDFSESAWDVQQPIVAIVSGNNLDVNKCSIKQQ